jgi:uncharacterized protein
MKGDRERSAVIEYWMEKAKESLSSARSEQNAGRFVFAINRAYYGCFYSASAVLLKRGEKFSKHSGVRAALHRSLVKTGEIDKQWGKFYDLIFNSRQRGDYQELISFSSEEAEELISQAEGFIDEMTNLLKG